MRVWFSDMSFEATAFSVGVCPACPHVHLKLYEDKEGKHPAMILDISKWNLDDFIEQLIIARNNMRMRVFEPAEATHDAPEAKQ